MLACGAETDDDLASGCLQIGRALLAPLREEVWAVGLKQGDDELKAKVNDVLARMRGDGSFGKLAERFMAKEKQMMTAQGLPFVFELK